MRSTGLKWTGVFLTGALLLLSPALAQAQSNPNAIASQVEALNNTLIMLYGQSLGQSPTSAATTRRQAEEAIESRLGALQALIAADPERGLTLGFSADFLQDLSAAFPGAAANLEQRGTFTGAYEPEYIDGDAGYRLVHGLRLGQRRVEVFFTGEEPEGSPLGLTLTVEGLLAGEAMAAGDSTTTSGPEAAAGQSCSTLGNQRVAIIKARPSGSTASLNNASIASWMFGTTGTTLSEFWMENSYGDTWATGDVYPAGTDAWYELSQNYICDDYAALRSAAIALADSDIDFNEYERVMIAYPHPGGSCFAGIASIGCWLGAPDGSPSISYAIQILSSMDTQSELVQLGSHELGHNLGLPHGRAIDFGTEPLGGLNDSGTYQEYGDRYSTMGFWNFGHYAAPHKRQMGWLDSYQTISSPGTYSVVPYSTNGGVQALEIARGTDNTESEELWVEFRRNLGSFNSTIGNATNGGLVHLENGLSGGRTQLVDFTPGTSTSCGPYYCNDFYDASLNVGQSWSDAASNVSLTVVSASDSGLQVQVDYGPIQCEPASPAATISPSTLTVNQGDTANYSVSVLNNDNAGCTSSTFNLSSSLSGVNASNLSASFDDGQLTVAPGSSQSTTLTVTTPGPPTAAAGSHTVTATGTRSGGAGESDSASAGLTILEPSYTVTISLSGNGTVDVSSGPSCGGGTCSFQYGQSAWQALTLTAVKTHRKQVFCSWGGDCASAGTDTTCSLTDPADYSATALFAKSCPGDGGGGGGGNGGGGNGGGGNGGGRGGGKPPK
jgi:M6 family metalloprotease-like protein